MQKYIFFKFFFGCIKKKLKLSKQQLNRFNCLDVTAFKKMFQEDPELISQLIDSKKHCLQRSQSETGSVNYTPAHRGARTNFSLGSKDPTSQGSKNLYKKSSHAIHVYAQPVMTRPTSVHSAPCRAFQFGRSLLSSQLHHWRLPKHKQHQAACHRLYPLA